ncbi:MAG: hypothetical protein K6E17_03445, partial [Clostridiales bacterium]|nr:hypothetical protein [Clostridiales bacterium]
HMGRKKGAGDVFSGSNYTRLLSVEIIQIFFPLVNVFSEMDNYFVSFLFVWSLCCIPDTVFVCCSVSRLPRAGRDDVCSKRAVLPARFPV